MSGEVDFTAHLNFEVSEERVEDNISNGYGAVVERLIAILRTPTA